MPDLLLEVELHPFGFFEITWTYEQKGAIFASREIMKPSAVPISRSGYPNAVFQMAA